MIKKSEIDYLNYNDLNEIEAKINQLTEEISKVVKSIPIYNKKTWILNELPFIQEIDRIEKAIYNLGEYYIEPKGWQTLKKWITDDNLYPIKSFDYRDWNRWINNLNLIDTSEISNMTLWDGNSLINWNEISDINWIDNNEILIKGKIIELLNKFKIIIKYLKLNGITKQETTEGKNLYNVFDEIKSKTKYTTVDNDGWITMKYDNTNGTQIIYPYYSTHNLDLNVNTQYALMVEIKELSGNFVTEFATTHAVSQNATNIYIRSNYLSVGTKKYLITTKNSFEGTSEGLRTVISVNAGATAKIVFRMSVLADTAVTTDNFVYEPYTGGQPSPSPDYPQEIEVGKGKNLWDISKQITFQNINYDVNTGIYSASDKDTRATLVYKIQQQNELGAFISDEQITKNVDNKGIINFTSTRTENAKYIRIANNGSTSEFSLRLPIPDEITVGDKFTISLNIIDTTIGYSKFKEVQLLKGEYTLDNLPDYEPYNTIEVKSTGKNLLDFDDFLKKANAEYTTEDDVFYITKIGTMYSKPYPLKLESGKRYTLSQIYQTQGTTNLRLEILRNGTIVTGSYATIENHRIKSFTANDGEYTIRGNYTQSSLPITFNKPMLEQSSTATDYEPYKESSITYDLGDNFLADKDYIENGVLNKNIGKVVLNGSFGSYNSEPNSNWFYIPVSYFPNIDKNNLANNIYFSDYFTRTPLYKTNDNGIYNNGTTHLLIRNKVLTSADEYKEWLNENKPVIYYKLAETEQVQLETTGELKTFEPNTIITNSLDSQMEIGYIEEGK